MKRVEETWLEVALNGGWGRDLQALSPLTVEKIRADGVASVGADAATVHFHAFDEVSLAPGSE